MVRQEEIIIRIGLIDVDGHNFPNLALMRISAYHKSRGDEVEWWWTDLIHYDIVYMSKIFSDAYSKDVPEPMNADKVIKGGTGYAISLDGGGVEVFDKSKHKNLPPEIEKMFPDYSIYPQFDFAVSMTSRGCPRKCPFCHVGSKEGCMSRKVANVSDFWNGQKHIEILDPNITACKDKRELFRQYMETGATLNFNQGLDMRCINDQDIEDINRMRIVKMHFAWDNPEDNLEDKFRRFSSQFRKANKGMVYCLTNFEPGLTAKDHIERAIFRIMKLSEMKYDPYVMIYDKPHAPQEIIDLQRWCNNKIIFKKVRRFADYVPTREQRKRVI